jgi:nucleoside-diphosphate-sugar epimerase
VTRYLITGAQGFVGRYLVAHLLFDQTSETCIMGTGRSARMKNTFTHAVHWGSKPTLAPLTRRLASIEADCRYDYASVDINRVDEIEQLLVSFRPDLIIHLASSLRDDPPASLFRTNVEGTINLLEAIHLSGTTVNKVVIASSGGVYGVPTELPIREGQSCIPIDLYSISKLAQEHAGRVLAGQKDLRIAFARIFNVVGPAQDERHICGQLVANVVGILSNQRPAVINHGPLHPTRDLIDVRDVAQALAMITDPSAPDGAFNVAGGIESSMHEVLDTILNLAGLERDVTLYCRRNRPTDIPRHVASIERLRSLGYQPRYTLRKSLEDLMAYYLYDVQAASLSSLAFPSPRESAIAKGQEKSTVSRNEDCA